MSSQTPEASRPADPAGIDGADETALDTQAAQSNMAVKRSKWISSLLLVSQIKQLICAPLYRARRQATAALSVDRDEATLRFRMRISTMLSFCLALLVGVSFSALVIHLDALQEHRDVEAIVTNHTSLLEERLGRSLSATYALSAVLLQGDGDIARFDTLGAEMLRTYEGLHAVQLAPGGVVSAVVPFVGNSEAIGHDLLADPERSMEAHLAIATRRLTLSRPLKLKQGETGLIGRLPVFMTGPDGHEIFWGFCIAVIGLPDLLASSGLAQLESQGYRYRLAYLDAKTGKHTAFAQSSSGAPSAPASRAFGVPNGEWTLSVSPKNGWVKPWLWITAALGSLVLALMVAAFTRMIFRQPLILRRQVAARVQELAEANSKLGAEVDKRQHAQREVNDANRLYSLLSHTNSAIVRISERDQLLDEICRVSVDVGGFALARIALLGSDGRSWNWLAERGAVTELPACNELVHARLQEHGNRIALKICSSMPSSLRDSSPLCTQAAAAGMRSHLVLQLRMRSKVIGLFSLHAREADYFDEAQLRLLEEMTGDVSFALEHIEREESRRQTEANLRKLSRAVEQSASAVLITDRNGIIEYVNPWFCRITGYTPDEVLGRTPRLLRSPDTQPETHKRMWEVLLSGKEWSGELHNTKKNGDQYWCLETISPLKDDAGEITHFVAVTEDISERKENEQAIRHLALHDPLTALPNRRLFNDRLRQAVVLRHRKDHGFALALLDIDRFKTINDTLGHDAGDALLKAVAARLAAHCRDGDTLARMGGDEFGLIAMNIAQPEEAGRVAEKSLDVLKEPFQLYGQDLYVSASIGVTLFPDDAADAETLIRNADTALFRAKERGRNNFQFYTDDMNKAMVNRLRLENALRRAVARNEFMLHYQPQVDIASGLIHGAEALIRWRHPELGMVSPAQFIPLAEETGMIVDIGEWTLRTACAQAKAWEEAGVPLRVAVNLSARQFQQGDLAEVILSTLTEFHLPPHLLEVELTEGILMDDSEETGHTLNKLHAMGVQISIDDFGTGYSSLSYLKRLPIQILKIDQSFVRDIHHDADDRAIVTAVIALAHSLKLKVIAEGVETTEQLAFLREHRCDMMQGYLFSRPIPGPELLTLHLSGADLKS